MLQNQLIAVSFRAEAVSGRAGTLPSTERCPLAGVNGAGAEEDWEGGAGEGGGLGAVGV